MAAARSHCHWCRHIEAGLTNLCRFTSAALRICACAPQWHRDYNRALNDVDIVLVHNEQDKNGGQMMLKSWRSAILHNYCIA